MKQDRLGFTLIELLIVVAIIGILAAIAVPNFMNAQIRAKVARSYSEMRTYKMAQQQYFMDHGDFPGHYDGKEEHCPYINLGYLNAPLKDPFTEHKEEWAGYKYQEGMYHSSDLGSPAEIALYNPGLYSEWMSSGQGYVVYGEGPALQGAWITYDSSNGLRSAGRIISVSIRGKGQPGSNMQGRKCN